jgi:hypothetical protein
MSQDAKLEKNLKGRVSESNEHRHIGRAGRLDRCIVAYRDLYLIFNSKFLLTFAGASY